MPAPGGLRRSIYASLKPSDDKREEWEDRDDREEWEDHEEKKKKIRGMRGMRGGTIGGLRRGVEEDKGEDRDTGDTGDRDRPEIGYNYGCSRYASDSLDDDADGDPYGEPYADQGCRQEHANHQRDNHYEGAAAAEDRDRGERGDRGDRDNYYDSSVFFHLDPDRDLVCGGWSRIFNFNTQCGREVASLVFIAIMTAVLVSIYDNRCVMLYPAGAGEHEEDREGGGDHPHTSGRRRRHSEDDYDGDDGDDYDHRDASSLLERIEVSFFHQCYEDKEAREREERMERALEKVSKKVNNQTARIKAAILRNELPRYTNDPYSCTDNAECTKICHNAKDAYGSELDIPPNEVTFGCSKNDFDFEFDKICIFRDSVDTSVPSTASGAKPPEPCWHDVTERTSQFMYMQVYGDETFGCDGKYYRTKPGYYEKKNGNTGGASTPAPDSFINQIPGFGGGPQYANTSGVCRILQQVFTSSGGTGSGSSSSTPTPRETIWMLRGDKGTATVSPPLYSRDGKSRIEPKSPYYRTRHLQPPHGAGPPEEGWNKRDPGNSYYENWEYAGSVAQIMVHRMYAPAPPIRKGKGAPPNARR